MTPGERERFDALVEEAVEALPPGLAQLLETVPLIVEDRPTAEMLADMGVRGHDATEAAGFCGLHSGLMNTEWSVEVSGEIPNQIHLFREGILETAGGWSADGSDDVVYDEIMITLLHEIGHELGLDEDDLERLGYA